MYPHTDSGDIPADSMASAMVPHPPKMSSSLGRQVGIFPNISALASSIWSMPVALSMKGSRAWEKGGWQMSCSNPAILTESESSRLSPMADAILPAR